MIGAAELQLNSGLTQVGRHTPERITKRIGGFGPARERWVSSLTSWLSSTRSSAVVPQKRVPASARIGSYSGETSRERLCASVRLLSYAARNPPGTNPKLCSHAVTQAAKSAIRGS